MAQKRKTPQLIDNQLFEDEELIWWGQPIAKYSLFKFKFSELLPNLIIIGFAIGFIIFSQSSSFEGFAQRIRRITAFGFFPIGVFILLSILIANIGWHLLKPFRDWYNSKRTYYALTNKRAMIIKQIHATDVQSFYNEQMKQLQVSSYGNGIGDIIFSIQTRTRKLHSRTQKTVSYEVKEGFHAIPDVRTVEDFITQIFFGDDEKHK